LRETLGAELHAVLGDYVYGLEDPRDGTLFYVGRGQGDRVLQHARDALASDEATAKLDLIRAIRAENAWPKAWIIRRRLGRRIASAEVEAAIIDVLLRWRVPLTNLVRGADVENGIRSLDSLIAEHEAAPLETERPAVLVNIGRTWFEDMTRDELWDASRKWWLCRPEDRRIMPTLLLAEAQHIIRGAWTVSVPPRRQRVTWADLDERRRAFVGPEREFQPFDACCFVGVEDPEWGSLVGRHTRHLRRSYGSAFRYLNC
jgi:hypothetical protein